jgi:hypothetical protein
MIMSLRRDVMLTTVGAMLPAAFDFDPTKV